MGSMVKFFTSPVTVLVFIKLTKNAVPLRFRCGSCKLKFRCGSCKLKFCRYFNMFCDISECLHSLEPGETPSNSASHQAPSYVQRSKPLKQSR